MSKHERGGDVIIEAVDQKLDDLLLRFDDHLKWTEEQHKVDNARITYLEKAWRKIEYPILALGLIATGFLLWVGEKVAIWILWLTKSLAADHIVR